MTILRHIIEGLLLLLLAYINYIYAHNYSGVSGDPAIAVLAFAVSIICGNKIVLPILGVLGAGSLARSVYCWIIRIKRPLLLNVCTIVLLASLLSWAFLYIGKGISAAASLSNDSSSSLIVFADGDNIVYVKNSDNSPIKYVLSNDKDTVYKVVNGNASDTLVINNQEQTCSWTKKPYITFPIIIDNR